MRATSTFRRGADGKYDPKADPTGDLTEQSNYDNFRVAPGATHVLMDEKGPGVITHIWFTIAAQGRDHLKEIVLRGFWDGNAKPSVETPIGDFFGLNLASYTIYEPENRLLWRFAPRRLDAESLRDSLLFATGNLDLNGGGPPKRMTDDFRKRTVYGFRQDIMGKL